MHRTSGMSGPNVWSSGPDRVTRVSYHRKPGFLERAGNTVCGAVFGIVLIAAACPIMFFNEGRAVQTARSLDEGLEACVNLRRGDPPFESNNQKLVHFTGELATRTPVIDSKFGVSIHAAHLERRVEMLQWVEHTQTREYEDQGGVRRETTYSYSREWRSDLVQSNSFEESLRHRNPTMMAVSSSTSDNSLVRVGDFSLSHGLLGKLVTEHTIEPSLVKGLRLDSKQQIWDNYVVQALNPRDFQVGDVRIRWVYKGCSQNSAGEQNDQCSPLSVSVIAQQRGSTTGPYQTRAGDVLELLYEGKLTAEAMFEEEQSSNTALTWVLRGLGFFMVFIGLNLITSIVTNITSYIPLLGSLINFGIMLLNFSLALTISLLVIALGWLRYRPMLAMTLLAIGMLPYLLPYVMPESAKPRRSRAAHEDDDSAHDE